MSHTDHDDENPRHVGDYRLKQRLATQGDIETWLAEQVSVGRTVILDELLDLSAESRNHFLSESRARASVDHPYIASVYEAVDGSDHCIRASERLTGKSLQSIIEAGTTVEPVELTRALHSIAEANLHHEANNRSTHPLAPEHIYLESKHVTRIANLATTGDRGDGESQRDVEHLGEILAPLAAPGRPGSTRVLTVLAWMRGKDRPAPLKWSEIISLCDQIERQLSTPVGAATSGKRPDKYTRNAWIMLAAGSVIALAIIMLYAILFRPSPPPLDIVDRPAPVLIPSGDHPTHDGETITHPAFLIDARETSIGEYREFLETLQVLAADDRHRIFDHPDQPPEKTDHEPDDWQALLATARARARWNGHPVSLNSPVPGVDWWDAMAYANWRKARLPTQQEWAAAVRHKSEEPEEIPVGQWHPEIPADCPDLTPAGIHGVAGSLREWTREPAIDPANPLGRKQHIIVGGSYLTTSRHALSREWIADPSLRAPDLGFRLIRDVTD